MTVTAGRYTGAQELPCGRAGTAADPPNTITTMRTVAVALVAVATLAGCGGSSGESPRALPSVTASPSVVPSPTPTGKDAPTPQGAVAFTRYFYGRIEQAFATKNPALVGDLSMPACTSCQTYLRSLTRLRDQKERVEGFHISIVDAVAPALTGDQARVDIFWGYKGAVRYDANGKVISREPPLAGIEEQVDLQRSGSSWRVAEIRRIRVRG